MTPEIAQPIITASATIAGVIVAHLLLMWNEKRRAEREDDRRWHSDRHRLMQEMVEIAIRTERMLDVLGAFMPTGDVGPIHIWEVSEEEGLEGVITAHDYAAVKDDLFAITDMMNDLERTLAALSLVAEGEVLERGRELITTIADAHDLVLHLNAADIVREAAHEVLHAQLRLSDAGRRLLGAITL